MSKNKKFVFCFVLFLFFVWCVYVHAIHITIPPSSIKKQYLPRSVSSSTDGGILNHKVESRHAKKTTTCPFSRLRLVGQILGSFGFSLTSAFNFAVKLWAIVERSTDVGMNDIFAGCAGVL